MQIQRPTHPIPHLKPSAKYWTDSRKSIRITRFSDSGPFRKNSPWSHKIKDFLPTNSRESSKSIIWEIIKNCPENLERSLKIAMTCFETSAKYPLNKHRLRAKWRGLENSSEGKTCHKTPPRKRSWTPPTYDTISPPLSSHPVIFLRGNGHRPHLGIIWRDHLATNLCCGWGKTIDKWYPPTRIIAFRPICCLHFGSVSKERKKFLALFSGVAPANQTKERSVHELFTGAFRNKSSMWIVLVFPRRNTWIHKNGRNFMNFSFLALSLVWFVGATPDFWGIKQPKAQVKSTIAKRTSVYLRGGWSQSSPLKIFVFALWVVVDVLHFPGLGRESKNNKHKDIRRDTPTSGPQPSCRRVPFVRGNVPSVPRTFCPDHVKYT